MPEPRWGWEIVVELRTGGEHVYDLASKADYERHLIAYSHGRQIVIEELGGALHAFQSADITGLHLRPGSPGKLTS